MSSDSTPVELFLPIPGWPGYDVGTFGTVRSYWLQSGGGRKLLGTSPKVLKPTLDQTGYYMVWLWRDGKRKGFCVHTLVLLAHVGPCPPGMEACHDPDHTRTNCRLDNLRWDTRKGNHADKKKHGTWQGGEKNPAAKMNDEKVRALRADFGKMSNADLGKKYGVSRITATRIGKRILWKHVE